MDMDNNNSEQKASAPKKKKVSKKVLRQRRLSALAIIALIVLVFFIIIAKSCSKEPSEGSNPDESNTTTTTASVITTTRPPETTTTTTVTTMNPQAAKVQLSDRELLLNVGERGVSIIQAYPDNTSEENEVWTSMDESIATVDQWGYVTGVSKGETFIILSFNNNPDIYIEIKVSVADNAIVTPNEAANEAVTTGDGNSEPVADVPTTPVYGYTGSIDNETIF